MTKRTAFILYLLISENCCVSRRLYPTTDSYNATLVPMQNRSVGPFENFSLAPTTFLYLDQLPPEHYYVDTNDDFDTILNMVSTWTFIIKMIIVAVGLLGNVLIVFTLVERKPPTHNLMLISLTGTYVIVITKVYLIPLNK